MRDTIWGVLNQTFGNPQMLLDFPAESLATWHYHDNILQLYGYSVTNNTSALGVTTQRAGDRFGVDLNNPTSGGNFAHMDERAANNTGRGVFIDDIIIGFAERGEMVFDAPPDLLAFVPNPQYAQTLYNVDQIEQGYYQLTIRTAADYGTMDAFFGLGRDFDTNDRLSRSLGMQVQLDAAGRITDGTTFTLTDTQRSLTFEYDVVTGPADAAVGVQQGRIPVTISPSSSAEQIARAIAAAINAAFAQGALNLTAAVRGQPGLQSTSRIVELHGPAATNLAGGFNFPANSFSDSVAVGQRYRLRRGPRRRRARRPQGQLLLMGNTITDAAQFGIATVAGNRIQPFNNSGDPPTGGVGIRPYPGSPINFPSRNLQQLAPGVVVMNNILANNGQGGLLVAGDPGLDAPLQIARVINNTFYASPSGVIIQDSTPTILNNIFAQLGVGVQALGPTSTVLGSNIYQNNAANTSGVDVGAFGINLAPGDPLFANPGNRKFYLAAGSRAIDASLESLQERAALTAVKSPLGLPLSPMIAPDRDVFGQLRMDDPNVNSPAGMGGNVFKDRGAVERADFVAPVAVLLQPQDNDSAGQDVDRSQTYIRLERANLDFFSILLEDINGTGPIRSRSRQPQSPLLKMDACSAKVRTTPSVTMPTTAPYG